MHEEQISSGTTMIHVSGVCINFSVCFMKKTIAIFGLKQYQTRHSKINRYRYMYIHIMHSIKTCKNHHI